jgi:hypothetical protein
MDYDPQAIYDALREDDPVRDDTYWIVFTLADGTIWHEAERGGFGGSLDPTTVRNIVVNLNPIHAAQYGADPLFPLWNVPLSEHQTFIAFKVRRIVAAEEDVINAQDGDFIPGQKYLWAAVFGWKEVINGKTASTYVWLMYDGRVFVTNYDMRFDHPTEGTPT